MLNPTNDPLTAEEVLRRYIDESLPAFCGVPLDHVNTRGVFGEYPLDVAATRGNLEEVRALVEGGADVNARAELGNTALHEAAGQGHVAVVKFLLDRGASRAQENDLGQTALDIARLLGHSEIMILLERGTG